MTKFPILTAFGGRPIGEAFINEEDLPLIGQYGFAVGGTLSRDGDWTSFQLKEIAVSTVPGAALCAACRRDASKRIPLEKLADRVVLAVAELPDRNSPEGWPEAMIVTGDELRMLIVEALTQSR